MAKEISDKQRKLNKALHADNDHFGNRADGAGVATHLPTALIRLNELGACNSILDYGTGKGKLVKRLQDELPNKITVKGYDPAVAEFEYKPNKPIDIVTCLDVLEHIEMDSIDAVLQDIKFLTKNFCYLVIDLQPAVKTLADGRNAHILLAPSDWWINKLGQQFPCISAFPIYHEAGLPQKVVIACAHQPAMLPIMYSFLAKMKLFEFKMGQGVLAGMMRSK